MDSALPTTLLATAGLLAAYVCVRSFLRILPHVIMRSMRHLRDSVDQELTRRKLSHSQHQLANTGRLMATKRQLLDQLYARWRTSTDSATEVPGHAADPEWSRIISQLDEVDRELEQRDELTRERNREETEKSIAGFDRSVRRLWWLSGADLVLFIASGAVAVWVVATLYELVV